jgi:hypothetical protein
MKIHIIRQRTNEKEIQEMLGELETYIKLVVDVERNILAGGGEYHADCEEALLEDGSRQENVWGADWYPESRKVGFGALINIRLLFLLLRHQPVACPPSVAINIKAMMQGSVP